MADVTDSSQTKGINPLAAGLTGLVIGAAGATAIALSDEETRKKATKKAKQLTHDLQKWSEQTIHELQQKGKEVRKAVPEKVDKKSEEVKEELADADDKILHN